MDNLWRQYNEIPIVTRVMLTGALVVAGLGKAEVLTPFELYLNWRLVWQGQIWRLVSSFLFLGVQPVPVLLHLFFSYRYSRMLEEGVYNGRPKAYLAMTLSGWLFLLALQWILTLAVPQLAPKLIFLGPSYSIFIMYVWAKFHADVRMSLFGLVTFSAPYFPYVVMLLGILFGDLDGLYVDLCGIIAGHVYFFLAVVYPVTSGRNLYGGRPLMAP